MWLHKMRAFVIKDLIVESSYKMALALEVVQSVFPVFSFFFVSKLVPSSRLMGLTRYGGDYFPFVLVGLAFSQYFSQALSSFTIAIRRAQMAGCLEAMLSTRTRPVSIILLSPIYSFVFKTVHLAIVFAVGVLALGADFGRCNIPSVALTLVASMLAFSGLGMLAAAGIIALKKGDPIEWLVNSGLALVSGTFFPTEVLPKWLRIVSLGSPLTHALVGMRMALTGASIRAIGFHVIALLVFAVVLVPVGAAAFVLAVEYGRRTGSLSDY